MNVADELRGSPHSVGVARQPASEGGVPAEPGFYAWWVRPDALPDVPTTAHPREPLGLLYVGIAPSRPGSTATLRSRVVGQHLRGNTGASTFRLSLASLLFVREGWRPARRGRKVVLSAADNAALSAWQQANLRVRWCVAEEPWRSEATVIADTAPALNLADNVGGDFYAVIRQARRAFRAAAI